MSTGTQSDSIKPNHQNKKKTSRLAIATAVFFVLSLWYYFKNILGGARDLSSGGSITIEKEIIIAAFYLALTPILGAISLIFIYRSNNRLKGKRLVIPPIVISSLILFTMATNVIKDSTIDRICGVYISSLGKSMVMYAEDNEGKFPDPNHWCDDLLLYADADPKIFVCACSDAIFGESSYAMNINAAGRTLSRLPKKMVLLFEAKFDPNSAVRDFPLPSRGFIANPYVFIGYKNKYKDYKVYQHRWNQTGGPELLTPENHNFEGAMVLFANGRTEFVQTEDFNDLYWGFRPGKTRPDDFYNFQKPHKPDPRSVILTFAELAILLIFVTAVLQIAFAKHIFFFALITAVFSAAAGLLVIFAINNYSNQFTKSIHLQYSFPSEFIITAAMIAFISGIFYVTMLAKDPCHLKFHKDFTGFATSIAIVFGMIISSLISFASVFFYGEKAFASLPLTIPFGLTAGAIIGYLTGCILKRFGSINQNPHSQLPQQ